MRHVPPHGARHQRGAATVGVDHPVEKWPHWSWFPPLYDSDIHPQDRYTHLWSHLGSPDGLADPGPAGDQRIAWIMDAVTAKYMSPYVGGDAKLKDIGPAGC